MKLSEHFQSYQKEVLKDLPAGFTEFIKVEPTTLPNLPTLASYFADITKKINEAIESKNVVSYKNNLKVHQRGLIKALGIFVDKITEGNKEKILDGGFSIIKFSNLWIYFDKFIWTPRYTEEKTDLPKFSTYEMEQVFKIRPSVEKLDEICTLKKEKELVFTGELVPPHEVNIRRINDWMLPL